MNKIFLDANILIDFVNKGNELNKPIAILISQLEKQNKKFYCSPTTFAITYYFLSKLIKDKILLNKEVVNLFSKFTFTREDDVIMEKVKKTVFTDIEDALQYYSAMDSGVDLIITRNHFDFTRSLIPVYHPLQYINQFLL